MAGPPGRLDWRCPPGGPGQTRRCLVPRHRGLAILGKLRARDCGLRHHRTRLLVDVARTARHVVGHRDVESRRPTGHIGGRAILASARGHQPPPEASGVGLQGAAPFRNAARADVAPFDVGPSGGAQRGPAVGFQSVNGPDATTKPSPMHATVLPNPWQPIGERI